MVARAEALFTELLDLRKERIIAWGFCHAVLSAWWIIEDQVAGLDEAIERAVLLEGESDSDGRRRESI